MESKKTIKKLVEKYKGERGFFLSLLQEIQKKYNYIPLEILEKLAEELEISKSKLFGLATFYSQFSFEKRGKYLIRICEGTACHVKGSKRIREVIEKEFGIEKGRTTDDGKFTLEVVACVGSCFLSPVMMVNSNYYGNLTPEKAIKILKGLK